jgi:PASTA domain
VHGRTPLLALVIIVACWLPASAVAAPMPAGTYDVQLTNGTLNLGNGLLPSLPLSSGTTLTVAIGTQPISAPIGLTVLDSPITGAVSGSVSVTITGAGITLDPTTGTATVDASFIASMSLSGSIGGFPVSGSCSLGSQNSPVSVHLSTTDGSPWDATTNAFAMGDHTFALPAPVCSPALVGDLLSFLIGSTNSGDNGITLNGIATRRPDPPPVTTTSTTTTTSQPTTSTPGTTTTDGNPAVTTPLTGPNAVKACVVPKLVGKTLKQAKRALKRAGCKVGKANKKNSAKRKKGRIVKQRYKAGTKLPAGTKIPLTVSKGKKKARNHRSR